VRSSGLAVLWGVWWGVVVAATACAHREPATPVRDDKEAWRVGDVAEALKPCPADFPEVSVREVRSQMWPSHKCFAIRGHLTAAYREGVACQMQPLSKDSKRSRSPLEGPEPVPRCVHGWTFTDLSDPIVLFHNDHAKSDPPYIDVRGTASLHVSRPDWTCNKDERGQEIMPASTRFLLPSILLLSDVERLNKGLANIPIGIFGGQPRSDDPGEYSDLFTSIFITHACRLDRAPPGDAPRPG
jgi:hypothetical protein